MQLEDIDAKPLKNFGQDCGTTSQDAMVWNMKTNLTQFRTARDQRNG